MLSGSARNGHDEKTTNGVWASLAFPASGSRSFSAGYFIFVLFMHLRFVSGTLFCGCHFFCLFSVVLTVRTDASEEGCFIRWRGICFFVCVCVYLFAKRGTRLCFPVTPCKRAAALAVTKPHRVYQCRAVIRFSYTEDIEFAFQRAVQRPFSYRLGIVWFRHLCE